MDHLLKTKKEEKIQRNMRLRYIYQNKFNRACFLQDISYGDLKDLPRRAASDKILHDSFYLILLNIQNKMNIKQDLLQ